MITIEITEEVRTHEDMAILLERITELVRQGYTSGYEPSWELHGEEEPLKTCAECGGPMFIEDSGVAHHGDPDDTDHDADADHTPIDDQEYGL